MMTSRRERKCSRTVLPCHRHLSSSFFKPFYHWYIRRQNELSFKLLFALFNSRNISLQLRCLFPLLSSSICPPRGDFDRERRSWRTSSESLWLSRFKHHLLSLYLARLSIFPSSSALTLLLLLKGFLVLCLSVTHPSIPCLPYIISLFRERGS